MINTIERVINHDEQRLYLKVPITIYDGVKRVTISYNYQRFNQTQEGSRIIKEEINIVDLALEDENYNLIGATGSNKTTIFIEEDIATPGYLPTAITPGTWYVVLGAYKIVPQGCNVTITVEQTLKEQVLLCGDLHLHTEHSDGWYTVEELVERSKQNGLDFIALTDHNSMTSNVNSHSDKDITVIPGVEVTYYNGHYNLWGKARPVKTYTANTKEEVLKIMEEGKASGALLALNHPQCPDCGWHFGFGEEVPYDAIEIWNGPFRKLNFDAIGLWQQMLIEGKRIPAVAGSDCHHEELFRNIGTPATFVYIQSKSSGDILDAISKGRCFMGMEPGAPRIALNGGKAIMGDITDALEVNITIERLGDSDEVRLVDQTGVFYAITPGASTKYTLTQPRENKKFLRVEIWRKIEGLGETLASISNPIYFN